MRVFVDNNLSPHLARGLHQLSAGEEPRVTVTHIVDHPSLERTADDVTWIATLAAEGDWTVLTQDRLRKSPLEREALRASGLVVFLLERQWAGRSHWDKAAQLVRWWPLVLRVAPTMSAGAFLMPWRPSGKRRFEPVRR